MPKPTTRPLLFVAIAVLLIAGIGLAITSGILPPPDFSSLIGHQPSSAFPNLKKFSVIDQDIDQKISTVTVVLYYKNPPSQKDGLEDLLYVFKTGSTLLKTSDCVPTYLDDDTCNPGKIAIGLVTISKDMPSPTNGTTTIYVYSNNPIIMLDRIQVTKLLAKPPQNMDELQSFIRLCELETNVRGCGLFDPPDPIFLGLNNDQ